MVAFDGGTVRGACSSVTAGIGDEPVMAPQLVIDQAAGAALVQVQVDATGSKIAAFTTLPTSWTCATC